MKKINSIVESGEVVKNSEKLGGQELGVKISKRVHKAKKGKYFDGKC